MSDAWSQRENEHPPVDVREDKIITIELTFEYSSFEDHPSDWDWKKILKVDWVDVEDWEDAD
jgi:hypothetical protein